MSNFDHRIDESVAALLRGGGYYAQYSGWDFCGYVWWEKEQWACEVWRYGVPVSVVRADSLRTIMETVSDAYGHR